MTDIPEDVMWWEREMRKKWLSHQTIRLHAGECTRGEVIAAEAIAGLVISDAVAAILAERERIQREGLPRWVKVPEGKAVMFADVDQVGNWSTGSTVSAKTDGYFPW